jgi:catechol 2,3-dioxygenase-like lactoylglutathione lyase family enzyme
LSSEEGTFQRVAPILTSYDLDATEAFYTEQLGFQTVSKYAEAGYLILMRDQVSLHFARAEGESSTAMTMTHCYLYVKGVDAIYAQARRAGAVHPHGKLEQKPWGLREFTLLDRDRNELRIGEVIA